MLPVVFNIEAGTYKRNLCSYWLFYTFVSIYVFLQNIYAYLVLEITENAQPYYRSVSLVSFGFI